MPLKVTEEMHVAAVKVLQRAHGLDGLPQRMLDAMLNAASVHPPACDSSEASGSAIPARPTLPGDWKLVPHKPTREMLMAGGEEWLRIATPEDIWQGMWHAAPLPPSSVQAVDGDEPGKGAT